MARFEKRNGKPCFAFTEVVEIGYKTTERGDSFHKSRNKSNTATHSSPTPVIDEMCCYLNEGVICYRSNPFVEK